jgi:hypothetical protein
MKNLSTSFALSLLVLSVPLLASNVNASQLVPTADSPAFKKDISVEIGVSYDSKVKKTTTTAAPSSEPVHTEEDCPEEEVPAVTDIDDHGYGATTLSTQSRDFGDFNNQQRISKKIGLDTLLMISRDSDSLSLGAAYRLNNLGAISAGIDTDGDIKGTLALSVPGIRNLSAYSSYEFKELNYGAQYQIDDLALRGYGNGNGGFGFGVSLNFGSVLTVQAPVVKAPIFGIPEIAEVKPLGQAPVGKPPVQAPTVQAPVAKPTTQAPRGRG